MDDIRNLVETSAYVDDLDRAEQFYHDVLELEVIGREAGRHVFFRVGNADVLLLFNANETAKGRTLPRTGPAGRDISRSGSPPPRSTPGGVGSRTMAWRSTAKYPGPREPHSLYFRDPAGNSVELITPGLWGLRSGW